MSSWCCCLGSTGAAYQRHEPEDEHKETPLELARRNWQQTWLTVITLVRACCAACGCVHTLALRRVGTPLWPD